MGFRVPGRGREGSGRRTCRLLEISFSVYSSNTSLGSCNGGVSCCCNGCTVTVRNAGTDDVSITEGAGAGADADADTGVDGSAQPRPAGEALCICKAVASCGQSISVDTGTPAKIY